MNNTYRLLQEVIWLFSAEEDPEFSPHMLHDLKNKLRDQLLEEIQSYEVDSQWRVEEADTSILDGRLPKGWIPKVRQPSVEYRFTAMSPVHNGHRIVVTSTNPSTLEQWVNLYNELSVADPT